MSALSGKCGPVSSGQKNSDTSNSSDDSDPESDSFSESSSDSSHDAGASKKKRLAKAPQFSVMQ